MSNYNKVKNEGVESAEFEEIIWDLDAEDKRKARDFLSTYAEKVHKATLEDVLEFVESGYQGSSYGEDWSVKSARNIERQRIRDYIKTLTK